LSDITGKFDRLPPHSIEAEMCLIGSLIVCEPEKRATFSAVRSIITRECFYQADHQIYFDALCDLYERGSKLDGAVVAEEMRRRQIYEEVGGNEYLTLLIMSVPTHRHAATYARTIKEKSLLRSLIALSNDAIRDAYSPSQEDVAQKSLMDFASKASKLAAGGSSNEVHRIGDVVMELLDRPRGVDSERIATGLDSLDKIIGGLRKGGKTIIGSRPGMGKSAFIKQVLRSIAGGDAERKPRKVGLITIEERKEKVAENLLANESGVCNNRIAFGTASPPEWEAMVAAGVAMDGLDIFIVDTARKLSAIVGVANVLACQYGCEVIAVDHLHLIDGETDERREREISKISAELKWVWKDLNVAGIEAAQLNRGSGTEPPTLSSLRDSGSLEQDGDLVIMLHRRDYYAKSSLNYEPDNILQAIIEKNKDGATATVPLRFDEARQRITDAPLAEDPFGPNGRSRPAGNHLLNNLVRTPYANSLDD